MTKTIYYVWKDIELSNDKTVITYVTDYLTRNNEGLIWIDGYGFRKCELIVSGDNKQETVSLAEKAILLNLF